MAAVLAGLALVSLSVQRDRNAALEIARYQVTARLRVAAAKPIERWPNPVWFLVSELSSCGRNLSSRDRWRIAGAIHDQSQRYGYDPLFVLALIEVESTCSPSARGPQGARGLIQIKPSTARAISREAGWPWSGTWTLARPAVNLRLGLHYLAKLEKRYGDRYLALAAYNMGPTRAQGMQRWEARRTEYVRRIVKQYEAIRRRAKRTTPADVRLEW